MFGCLLLSSYLILFIQFYMQTYKKPIGKKPVVNGKANGVANGLVVSFRFLVKRINSNGHVCSNKTE